MMETIEFRIREHKFSNGIIHFIPERSIERKPFPEGGPDWININEPDGFRYSYYTTYENAFDKIKEFLAENSKSYEFDIIHNLPEFKMTTPSNINI